MTPSAYAFAGLTAIVAALIGVLVFAVLRFAAAARDSKQLYRENRTETAFVTVALQEALTKLKAQEREMSARAEASERLSEEIVESLTAGLLVVGSDKRIRILNPAGRRMLGLPESAVGQDHQQVLHAIGPLARVIEECLTLGEPIVRRELEIASDHWAVTHLGVSVSALTDGRGQRHGVICLFTDLTPIIELAMALHKAGQEEPAVAAFQKAIELAPEEPTFRLSLGISFEALKRPVDAARAYEEYLQLSPTAPDAAKVKTRIEVLRKPA